MKKKTLKTNNRGRKLARRAPRSSMQPLVSSRLIACVPTTWLDDLLSGPNAALKGKGGTWGCPDIERLLNAIRARMIKATNDQAQPRGMARKPQPEKPNA